MTSTELRRSHRAPFAPHDFHRSIRCLQASTFALAAVVAGLGAGCDGSSAKHEDELDGVATIALTASSGVGSVRVEFKGTTRTIIRCLAIDGAPTTRLQGLPTGSVAVSASSFSSTDCTGEATWVADDQTVQLSKGQVLAIQIVFRPNGIATITTSYVDDVPLLACSNAFTFVPREAMAQDVNGPGGTGLHAVYDDGDVRDEGPIYFGPHESGWVASYYPADKLADSTAPALWQTISGIGGETLTGYIIGPRDGSVAFYISGDDYVSMDLGNGMLSLLADNTGAAQGSVVLQAGVHYPITLRYMNRWGTNWFQFYWQCP